MFNKSRLVLLSYITLPALTATGFLATMPNDGQNAILFGLSKSRLMVALVLFLVAVFFVGLALFTINHTYKIQHWLTGKLDTQNHKNLIVISSGLVFFLACAILGIPDKYLGGLWAIEERLRPLVTWVLLTSSQVLIGMIAWQFNFKKESHIVSKEKVIAASTALGIMLSIWFFIAITGLGLISSNTFWAKVGVPLLWPQVFLALGIGLGLQLLLTRSKKHFSKIIWLDIGLIVVIWVAAVILWNNQTYEQGVFNTPPRPPTNEIYPINDSLIFDVAAQKMLVGQKMIAGVQDKPIFISFLAILHFLAGTSYARFYLFQIMCFAFIPVCGYFIGRTLHSRPLGSMFAVLLLLKELNAIILTNYIHVSTSKMILSEMLTTLGVLLFTLFMLKWMKSLDVTNPNLWIAGGILGLTSLARLNSIGILPAAIFMIGLASNFKRKRWIIASITLAAFVAISVIPWTARNMAISGDPFNFIKSKTSGVIVNQRYDPIIGNIPAVQSADAKQANYLVLGRGIVTNYLHNLIGITLMLPPSFGLYNLLDLVRLPYWKLQWAGDLLPGGFWIILGVLSITSIGIASAWTRWHAAGLVPLAVILGYDITTALSLTSGGRYLVPMDWGILLYFSIGLLEAATWLMVLFNWPQSHEPVGITSGASVSTKNYTRMFTIVLAFLFFGATPVILESLPPVAYPNSVNMADFIKANQSLPEFSLPDNENSLTILANNSMAKVIFGKALYPRYYGENKGEGPTLEQDPLIGSAGFDHLSFLLIGGKDDVSVILPADKNLTSRIPGAETWVIGCQRTNYVEAIFVVFRQKENAYTYWQTPVKPNCQ